MAFKIEIEETGETFPCAEGQTVLRGMAALGRRGIPVGCQGGGCGICRVEVLAGEYSARVMSRDHISKEDEQQGRVLACRITPVSDMRLRVLGPMKKAVCFTSMNKPATEAGSTLVNHSA
jgi:ferredoxin